MTLAEIVIDDQPRIVPDPPTRPFPLLALVASVGLSVSYLFFGVYLRSDLYLGFAIALGVVMIGRTHRHVDCPLVGRRNPMVNALVTFWILAMFSSLWAIDPTLTIKRSVGLAAFLTVMTTIRFVATRGLEWVRPFLLWSALIISGFTIFTYRAYGTVRFVQNSRIDIALSNVLAGYLVILATGLTAFVIVGHRVGSRSTRLVSMAALVLSIYALVLTESRGGLVLLPVAALCILVLAPNQHRLLAKASVFFGVAVVGGMGLIAPGFIDRALALTEGVGPLALVSSRLRTSVFLAGSSGSTDSVRSEAISATFDAAWEHFPLGVGYENMLAFMENSRQFSTAATSHSLLTTGMAELGFLGLVLTVWFLVAAWRTGRRALVPPTGRLLLAGETSAHRLAAVSMAAMAIAHGFVRPQLQNPFFFVALGLLTVLGDPARFADDEEIVILDRDA